MAIQVGDRIPSVTLKTMTADGPQSVSTDEYFAGKKVALFAVPGAFTPACNDTHLPGFLVKADEFGAKGIDEIACVSVNDIFVMNAWGKATNSSDYITMLADGNGELAKALGLELDGSGFGLGIRSKRYAAVIDDGVVKVLNAEAGAGVEVSTAENLLASL